MHTPMTTVRPASSPIRRASSFAMPSCNHSTFAPRATACSATSGVCSARRNTSTTSIASSSGTSSSDAYARSPSTSVAFGLTGTIR